MALSVGREISNSNMSMRIRATEKQIQATGIIYFTNTTGCLIMPGNILCTSHTVVKKKQ